jgi:hypothetical protein
MGTLGPITDSGRLADAKGLEPLQLLRPHRFRGDVPLLWEHPLLSFVGVEPTGPCRIVHIARTSCFRPLKTLAEPTGLEPVCLVRLSLSRRARLPFRQGSMCLSTIPQPVKTLQVLFSPPAEPVPVNAAEQVVRDIRCDREYQPEQDECKPCFGSQGRAVRQKPLHSQWGEERQADDSISDERTRQ